MPPRRARQPAEERPLFAARAGLRTGPPAPRAKWSPHRAAPACFRPDRRPAAGAHRNEARPRHLEEKRLAPRPPRKRAARRRAARTTADKHAKAPWAWARFVLGCAGMQGDM